MSDPLVDIHGQTVKLPAIVRDASSGTAMYRVNAAAAQKSTSSTPTTARPADSSWRASTC